MRKGKEDGSMGKEPAAQERGLERPTEQAWLEGACVPSAAEAETLKAHGQPGEPNRQAP